MESTRPRATCKAPGCDRLVYHKRLGLCDPHGRQAMRGEPFTPGGRVRPRRVRDGGQPAADGDLAVLERLAEALESREPVLGELVEEEHAEVRERWGM